ncbi:MAG: glycine cleavage system protein GcvH [Planctomycetota bacterium]
MPTPADRVYSESHEWHKQDGDVVTLGITEFAVNQLTDVTFVELKPTGTTLDTGDAIGEVESVKTTSDVYASVAGEIIEINEELDGNPGLINQDPYEAGWLVRIRVSDASGLDKCVDAAKYEAEYAD